jgi:glycosyltransferase involved in cell wall biosynthesis
LTIEPGFVADEDVPSLYGPATVAMFPYREIEASGVMFLALAHGRPIIASRLGSFAELLVDGCHGHLVPPDDIPALTAAMSHMIADRSFAKSCAAAVRSLATDIPDWNEIARRTVQTYNLAGAPRVAAAGRLMADAAD